MSDIPPDLLAEVLREVEEEQGHPDKYTVPIDELLERLVATRRADAALIPFPRMPDTVPTHAGYRSHAYTIHRPNRPQTRASAGFRPLEKNKLIRF